MKGTRLFLAPAFQELQNELPASVQSMIQYQRDQIAADLKRADTMAGTLG
jgi:hypothetical protein